MRIINLVGHSCSGKTTLLKELVPMIAEVASVATVKHMGHHVFELPKGKDTTVHYEAGSSCTAGIDQVKSVLTLKSIDVYTVLDIYDFLGYDYCIIEGYKEEGFACAVLGDFDAKNALMRNPTAEELFEKRDLFPVYHRIHVRKTA